ncbi:DUF1491 family protein [Parvularcula maris]|uniref:DUF1491 family protein n=1 Tax=Parvularcula maris TaxID=2965077 RepID=A0A9X2L755_9PROT|nr:DUF1491 family protein [Parvularcula maris]MCQ8184228.1 DUF1491 family protein [Parvularcula maris]
MSLRLRSDVQVSAMQRSASAAGLFFAVLDKGHEEGGLIYVQWRDGRELSLFTEREVEGSRVWTCVLGKAEEMAVRERLASERSFDPDLWVVEVEGPLADAERVLQPLAE